MRTVGCVTMLLATLLFSSASSEGARQQTIQAELQAPAQRQPAPGFRLRDASGKTVALSDSRGTPVVLNLWATDCGGCRTELPTFVEVHQTYGQRGPRVIGVSMDVMYEDLKTVADAWARVTPFARTHGLAYTILVDDGSVEKSYNVTQLPATYLIDGRGRVAATYSGVVDAENLKANIKALLAEPSAR